MRRVFELRIPVDEPFRVRMARRSALNAVGEWRLRSGIADDVCLVVSELVTNAFVHGRSDAFLRVLLEADHLRVETTDDDTRLPVSVAPDGQSLSGRGLSLVASLATFWGAERIGSGNKVWAEFAILERRHLPREV